MLAHAVALRKYGQGYNRAVLAFQITKGKLKPKQKRLPKLWPGWALVRVRLAGICNTDIEILPGITIFEARWGTSLLVKSRKCAAFRPQRRGNGWGGGSAGKLMFLVLPMALGRLADFASGGWEPIVRAEL